MEKSFILKGNAAFSKDLTHMETIENGYLVCEDGYAFDALVLDDSAMNCMRKLSIRERIERACYNDVDCVIREKFVAGKHIFSRSAHSAV